MSARPVPPAADRAEDPLMRVSEFHRSFAAGPVRPAREAAAGATRLAALTPSLLQDLLRFERAHRPGDGLDLLEVLAAALRHGRALRLHLQLDYRVLPITVLAAERRVLGPRALRKAVELRLPDLRVLRVEPAESDPQAHAQEAAPDAASLPLAPLMWELALRGTRAALLPEIAGVAAYRVVPGADLSGLALAGTLAAAVARLRRQSTGLAEIAGWPGFDLDRAGRLLNGLYLHSALMISRSHPNALPGAATPPPA